MIVANEPRKKRVFIAASWADAAQLRKTVRNPDFDVVTLEEAATPGTSWVESVHRCLDDADMVIGIMGDRTKNMNVLFELGVASGLNKPTLLFVAPDYPAEFIPPSGIPYLRMDLRNEDAVMFGLKQMLAIEPRDHARQGVGGFTTKPIGILADQFLARLVDATPMDFEQLIFDVVQASKASTIVRGKEIEREGIDLAVWSNDLEPTIANPLLIECKLDLSRPMVVDATIGQMLRALAAIRNGYGIVLYRGLKGIAAPITGSLPLDFVPAAEFIAGLRDLGLAEYVRKLRNVTKHES